MQYEGRELLCLLFPGEQFFLEVDAQFLSDIGQLVEVGAVLVLVFDLVLQRFEHSDGGGVVVDSAARLQRLFDHGGGGDQVVRETVVEDSLHFEQVVGVFEFQLVSRVSMTSM